VGQVEDVKRVVTPDLKSAGSRLAIVGLTCADTAGSQLEVVGRVRGGRVPTVDATVCRDTFAVIAAAQRAGLVAACHDCSDGGLLAAVAEMAIGGAAGATIDLAAVPAEVPVGAGRDLTLAFAESPGRFICEVPAAGVDGFQTLLAGHRWGWIGTVTDATTLTVNASSGQEIARVAVERLADAWRSRR
jgi:phosphoribosylformylglycinamidine synthase